MPYSSPLQVPATFQSRPDSVPSKAFNCGPSAVVHVARFYTDRDYGIQATRRLVVSNDYRGTTPSERAAMLAKRGVPCRADRIAPSSLIALLGTRPVSVALSMAKVPYPYRRYAFTGMHELAALAVRSTNSVGEVAFMDPNYGWPDGKTGYVPDHIWMPYSVWAPAFVASGGWAVIPDRAKVIPTRSPHVRRCTALDALNVRSGPATSHARIVTVPKGTTFTSTLIEKSGGAYTARGVTRRDWLAYTRNGRTVWVARGFVKEG